MNSSKAAAISQKHAMNSSKAAAISQKHAMNSRKTAAAVAQRCYGMGGQNGTERN